MLDLTKITTAFGLLDEETKMALRAHFDYGGVIEMVGVDGWTPVPLPAFTSDSTYRAKPKPRVIKARYGVSRSYSSLGLPAISDANFGANWRTMTGEIVVGDDDWPVSITLKREGAE